MPIDEQSRTAAHPPATAGGTDLIQVIGLKLGRTENAVRTKASEKGVSLKSRNQSLVTDRKVGVPKLLAAAYLLSAVKIPTGICANLSRSAGFLCRIWQYASRASQDRNDNLKTSDRNRWPREAIFVFRYGNAQLKGFGGSLMDLRTLKRIRKRKSRLLTDALSFAAKQNI